ncbi:Na+/H+ antiporter subunit E [Legionella nagasakiensis]|uniref:Na+/H+ antiporter subunit E n=1 Tax=Legionella nagasakiensis TaxID=535290 RepID=UPI0010553371
MSRAGSYLIRFFYLLFFVVFVIYEIIIASFRVSRSVLLPRYKWQPALIDFPLSCTKNTQITFLANVVSLTPGTLALEISADQKNMLLHIMFFSNKQHLIERIKQKFEQPIMEIWP